MRDDHDVTDMFRVDENFGQRRSKKRTALDEVIFWFSVGAITLIITLSIGNFTGATTNFIERLGTIISDII